MKFLIFTTDVIPIEGYPTSGTALRTWGIGQGLICHGHEVEYSVPITALEAFKKKIGENPKISELERLAFDGETQDQIINEINPDVVICGHWPAVCMRTRPSQAVITDLAGPHLLERFYQDGQPNSGLVNAKLNAMSKSDYFITSGKRQRLYFLSFLQRLGTTDIENRWIEIPMALDPNIPPEVEKGEGPDFVFGGVFLPWQNPTKSLMSLEKFIAAKNSGSLTIIGGKHPIYPIKTGFYQEVFDKLATSKWVKKYELLPYAKYLEEIKSKHASIELMEWNLERELAVTIRTTTTLWSGVPVIYNDFSDLGDMITKYRAGWTVSPSDDQGLTRIFEQIYEDKEDAIVRGKNARKLAREVFGWDIAVEKLINFFNPSERGGAKEIDIILDFPEDTSIEIKKEIPVTQKFTSRIDGLCEINFRLATHGIPATSALNIRILKNDSTVIVKKSLKKEEITNNDWHSVSFSAINDSAGNDFSLELTSEDENSKISPWVVKSSPYPLKGITIGSTKINDRSFCLKTISRT